MIQGQKDKNKAHKYIQPAPKFCAIKNMPARGFYMRDYENQQAVAILSI